MFRCYYHVYCSFKWYNKFVCKPSKISFCVISTAITFTISSGLYPAYVTEVRKFVV
jgi:hypothetical protein